MARRKILISGYYGYGNAGDEAILGAILQAVTREVPDADFCVLSGNPERTRRDFGVRAIPGKNPLAILKELWSSHLLLSGGGGLIQDSTGVQTVIYYLGVVSMARKLRRPVMFYAQGIGPVRTAKGRDLTRRIASRVQLITVRDEESRALLDEIGVKGPRVVITADPVIALEPATPARVNEILAAEEIADPSRTVGLSLRPWSDEARTREAFVALGKDLVSQGYAVLVMPFQDSQDREVCTEVARGIGSGAVVPRREYGPTELMGVVGRLHSVIGMRLHALIFGGAQLVPVAGVAYDPKVSSFLRRVEAPVISLEDVSAERLIEVSRALVSTADAHRERLRRLVPPLVDQSRETARLLAGLLGVGGASRQGNNS